jgi:hypothetical protein
MNCSEEIQSIIKRLNKLEKENRELKNENQQMKETITQLKNDNNDVSNQVKLMKRNYSNKFNLLTKNIMRNENHILNNKKNTNENKKNLNKVIHIIKKEGMDNRIQKFNIAHSNIIYENDIDAYSYVYDDLFYRHRHSILFFPNISFDFFKKIINKISNTNLLDNFKEYNNKRITTQSDLEKQKILYIKQFF